MNETIIRNQKIKITPNYIFKYIIIFGVILFIGGFIMGYITANNITFNTLNNLIINNGILIFNDKYYTITEIYLNNTSYNINPQMLYN